MPTATARVMPPEPTLDEQLVHRCRLGDRAAFAELVHRHQGRVFGLCLRWLGDRVAAEEIAQDTFLSAWRALPGFRAEARFDTWLRRIAVNKCKNRKVYGFRRGYGLHDSIDVLPDEDRPRLQLVHGGPAADAGIHRDQADAIVRSALAALPDEQRAIVVLRDVEDLDYDEIADILEIPRGTVKSRLHRARTALALVLSARLNREDVF